MFNCEAALLRFLARCPDLHSNAKFVSLLHKGSGLSERDVVSVVAVPFIHPSYTVPIIGCFRPLCRQILHKVVAKLHAVPNLVLESGEDGEEIGKEDMDVIDFYVGRGRGLKLHELACLAFCRALELAPFLLPYLLTYFQFAPAPFRRLMSVENTSHFVEKVDLRIIDVVRVSYRLLLLDPKVFSELWDWSAFFNLAQHISCTQIKTSDLLFNKVLDIKWCVIQILSIIIWKSDRIISNFDMRAEEAFACLLRWEEFCQDTQLEKTGWYLKEDEVINEFDISEHANIYQYIKSYDNCLYSLDIDFQRSSKNNVLCEQKPLNEKFVLTTAMKKVFEMIWMAANEKWPVLLFGPAASGKTSLINDLALKSGSKVLFIHMDEQMDSKSLIGSYISSEQPGEFKWQPGSLTQALLGGFWIVFEDIDKAPKEMQSILLPLLEGSSSFVTCHGEVVSVSERFRLFGTISTLRHELQHTIEGRFSFSNFWRKVMVQTPNKDEMIDIINARYPILNFLSSQLVDTFERVNSLVSFQLAITSAFNRFSLRDLLKWCKRIAMLPLNLSGIGLSLTDSENICQEAVDVFISFLPISENRSALIKELANFWNVPFHGEMMQPSNKPIIQMHKSDFKVGRVALQCVNKIDIQEKQPFVSIRSALQSLERIACSIKHNEPVLLVGETGTGKTTLVQNLAGWLGYPLIVLNLSQQTDVADLLGGYKPADAQSICMPLYHEFKELFCMTFSKKDNEALLRHCEIYILCKNWKKLLHACQKSVQFFQKQLNKTRESGCGLKRKRPILEETIHMWESFSSRLDCAFNKIGTSSPMSFKFVEGAFVTALKSGQWLLLDEVNLAPPETLQRIIGVLDGDQGTICLAERGDVDYIERHPNFRLFACMNPATDAGKRDLPFAFKSRFTEYFIDDVLDDDDLTLFVNKYLGESNTTTEFSNKIVQFYKKAKKESEERLQDSANQKPQFSLRSLARALIYTKKAEKKFGFKRALYDGFCMFFVTLLDAPSAAIMHHLVLLLVGNVLHDIPFDFYFSGNLAPIEDSNIKHFLENYVLTKSVKAHLKNLARALYIKRYPVLLQGPTSSGKTSLVRYLASITGHEFVRINNHEHTDLQEYFGSYITDSHGKLQFQEGVMVKAIRNGYWIVLDELNLAPSDVLEALNRLLDDNRELYVPELQETIPAHPEFMLFATQNPPTIYGGRKILSRAFRNRFLEIHVDEIPDDELITILENRCSIPASYASRMVEVMKDLQFHRQNSNVFAGKHGFITPRDLFRWANRFRVFGKSYEDLAKDGYFLLAERLREENEKNVVREVLERRLNVKLLIDELYQEERSKIDAALLLTERTRDSGDFARITWTRSMWRLYFLVERCYKLREPVLLVGDTGGGKTTVCQVLSIVLGSRLHILNCHQYTETSDFVGGFHPVRERPSLALKFRQYIERMKESNFFLQLSNDCELPSDISQACLTLNYLNEVEALYKDDPKLHSNVTQLDFKIFETIKLELLQLHNKWQAIFNWQDGPLVQAMKAGDLFLLDEISLADDSVLERLNSVLEPEKMLLLAEKGGSTPETITSHSKFFILATMNPGGDYGKKELSPALRNRFTEIWVPPVSDVEELRCIALEKLYKPDLSGLVDCVLNFWQWFNILSIGRMLTVRDLLSWVSFINVTVAKLGSVHAFLHGAFLVLLDGLSLGTGLSKSEVLTLRKCSLDFLMEELKASGLSFSCSGFYDMEYFGWGRDMKHTDISLSYNAPSENHFGINPFFIDRGPNNFKAGGFEFKAPTTCRNVLRVLRAMQHPRPVLLEGSPGVGKTSLIIALAQHSGHTVVRINLSDQTDMMDLLGSDLPVEGASGMEFSWVDGILLQALKNGHWVLLDELNLAPQSVLEGLNSILDHRSEVYIPEIGLAFKCPASFRVFACQNPSSQGGGRKGLPKSFLNRFTKVHVDELTGDDYFFICQSRYPSIQSSLLSKLITFNKRIFEDTMIHCKYGQDGSPWEFNLRDVIRSCEIIQGSPDNTLFSNFLNFVYLQRLRTAADRSEVMVLYEEVFGVKPCVPQFPEVCINPQYLIVGSACVKRNHCQPTKALNSRLILLPEVSQRLEAVAQCVQRNWLCILVGPSSSGKTSVLRLLSQLTGNVLNELNLSAGTDVSELLGCFEQYNFFHSYKSVICQIERYVNEYFCLGLELSRKDFIYERKSMFSKWLSFFFSHNPSKSSYFANLRFGKSSVSMDPLIEIIKQLQYDLNSFHLPVSYSCVDLDILLKTIQVLQKNWFMQPSAKFEWVPGILVKAIECGEWVVLDNANLCNPTVLDRINSLVEPNGSITINECGLVDGKPLVLNSHPNFRMFLTIDPKYGEVSRAMRNRGVEVFMLQPKCLPGEITTALEDIELNSSKRLLRLSGIPLDKMVLTMSEAHLSAKAAGLSFGIRITLLELTRWVQLFQQLIMNGNDPMWSLQLSWEHTYVAALGELGGRDVINRWKVSHLTDSSLYKLDPFLFGSSLSLASRLSLPPTLKSFVHYSGESTVQQNCLYLKFLCSQYVYYMNNFINCPSDGKRFFSPIFLGDLRHQDLFSDAQHGNMQCTIDLVKTNRLFFIAAKWSAEQATENDLDLYIVWFRWCHMKLQSHCCFFESICVILEQEKDHPIWKCIRKYRTKLLAHIGISIDIQHFPLLSLKLADFSISDSKLLKCQHRLVYAIHCVDLLRRTYHQWNTEKTFSLIGAFTCAMQPMLNSVRQLESVMLNVIANFHDLYYEYSYFLELHSFFWENIISSHHENLSIIWSWLKKKAKKIQSRFPEAVQAILVEGLNFKDVPGWKADTGVPTLWKRGGHPFVPSSSDIFYGLKQLTGFCDAIWKTPKTLKEIHKNENEKLDAIISTNIDFRRVALEGLCMSAYIAVKSDLCEAQSMSQLNEIYLKVRNRFEHEKKSLEPVFKSAQNGQSLTQHVKRACCVFSLETLCRDSCCDSWLVVLLLLDRRSLLLDINLLLKLLNNAMFDFGNNFKVLSSFAGLVRHALNYSLINSSRSPVDFSPHQTLLWIFDADNSTDSAQHIIPSLNLNMWFGWLSSLWNCFSERVKRFPWIKGSVYGLLPTRIQIIGIILQCGYPIKDYDANCLKLRATSRALWHDSPSSGSFIKVLFSSANCFFKQIVFVHEKHFDKAAFAKLKSILLNLANLDANPEELQTLKSLLMSSNHALFTSLVEPVILPLLEELYVGGSSNDSYSLGQSWVYIGILRLHLLLNADGPDPVAKSALKHSWILQRISLLELEKKVRQECELLSGKCCARVNEKIEESREMLEMEEKRAKVKVVFRPDTSKYKKLKLACTDFLEMVVSCSWLLKNVNCHTNIDIFIEMAKNLQANCKSFVNKFTEDFAEYYDLVQPIQVAVYEMMLGISLIISSVVEREYLERIKITEIESVLVSIYFLMQFPKVLPFKSNPITPMIFDAILLDSLIAVSLEVSNLQEPQSLICHITLLHVAQAISSSLVLNEGSFSILNEIFRRFSSFWMGMKSKDKASKEEEAQYFKFRPRSISLDNFFNKDMASFDMLGSGENCEELSMEKEFSKVKEPLKAGNIDDDWALIPESILRSLVQIHYQLFGPGNLAKCPDVCLVSDEMRLLLFMDSYRLGTTIIEGLGVLSISTMDDNLLPEHLLRVCLEYQWPYDTKSGHSYNVYKDPNAEAVFRMVEPLTFLQDKVNSLLDEWTDHPSLKKILEITETLLGIPPCTPVSKVLPGLQLLFNRLQFLQENDSRFNLKDDIQILYGIISSWQKLEVDSWPALLEGVIEQFEVNASKLWFPLYGVLHRTLSGDAKADDMLTIESVEEFVCTSNVGEFKKRLLLLLAFHGQLKIGVHLHVYSSLHVEENLKILYNAFGYYVQFLPKVLEHIETGKGSVEKDLKEYMKLFKWEQPCTSTSIESFRRTRQKILKIVQNFNDVLQQPVMTILNEEARLKREDDPAWFKQNISGKIDVMEFQFPIDLVKLRSTEKFQWFGNWKNKTNSTFENFHGIKGNRFFIYSEKICKKFKLAWDDEWNVLESICQSAAGFSHIWKHETRNLRKRRALSDLFKVLEKSGLSRHRHVNLEDPKSGQPSNSFLQPSYNMGHLLQQVYPSPSADANIYFPNKSDKNRDASCDYLWELSNLFYFRSLSMIQQLCEIQTCFSKDLTLEQANQLIGYIEHLVVIQRDQRCVAYDASGQLKKLSSLCNSLGSIENGGHCFLSPHPYLLLKHMWQQKDIFDSLISITKDMHIFLLTIKKSHMDGCNKIGDEADLMSPIFDKFVPLFMQSKDKLDHYLLGSNGVITASNTFTPSIVSIQMEHLVRQNHHIINTLGETVTAFSTQKIFSESVKEILLNRLMEIIDEGNKEMLAFNSDVEAAKQSSCDDDLFNKLSSSFNNALECAYKTIADVFLQIDCNRADHACNGVVLAEDLTSWKNIFKSCFTNLHLDRVHDSFHEAITAANQLVGRAGTQKPELCSQLGLHLRHLHLLLKILLEYSEDIILEFLDAHKTIAEITNVLACIFTSLLSKGFGTTEEQHETTVQGTQDACGTGMGDGEGINDVSDQIEEEAQLIGTSEKDASDSSDKVTSGKDRGIEMDEDFAANAFSVSEHSESCDEEDDGEDVNMESKMGESGDGDHIVDEKLWDKKNDAEPENCIEKYESGPSVNEIDSSGGELRAKQEDMTAVEEHDQFDKNGFDGASEEQKEVSDDGYNADDMMLDKNAAYEDPTGMQSTEQEKHEEDVMEEVQFSDIVEENNSFPVGSDKEIEDDDSSNPTNPTDFESASLVNEERDADDSSKNKDIENNVQLEPSVNVNMSEKSDLDKYPWDRVDRCEQLQAPSITEPSLEQEMCWSEINDMSSFSAPSSISKDEQHPNVQFMIPSSSELSKLAPDQPQSHESQGDETQSGHLKETNPFRSIAKALETWKEKASVLDDPRDELSVDPDYMNEDESAAEFRYVTEGEKSTSQALGAATADQIKSNDVNQNSNYDHDTTNNLKEHDDGIAEIPEHTVTKSVKSAIASISSDKHIIEQESLETTNRSEAPSEELQQISFGNMLSGNVVSFQSLHMNDKILPLVTQMNDIVLRSVDNAEISENINQKAIASWRKLELATAKLSLELTEQLRLVMEPTLASRLEGDYKTGKRINMKKVIPYIASHFRKDKIWLRRTKPNKRDYQVVVAIDDSRSMSESNCGTVAIEALVTVCRAMSQLEVGQFAVASFGEKGNIKLLHDFDQSFGREAGVKMISNLSFMQDNTIADEPVVDLLKHLNNMLDAAVARARTPSGQNPLHQLILIIADGRFHEKENLKRCIRNVLNKRRMIAFVLLDSPQESIMELMEACFEGQALTFQKYLNSFPFPYYIVLQNIEALPRTLADLLRQWFELMQNTRQ